MTNRATAKPGTNWPDFLRTPGTKCGYLPNRTMVSIFIDPRALIDGEAYGKLLMHGFRRSGEYVYRPQCPSCSACVPLRIVAADFLPSKNQKRIIHRNRDVTVNVATTADNQEQFDLYARYVNARHPGGGMDQPSPDEYPGFLVSRRISTCFYEFRTNGRLVAVSVVDELANALSAVYTFFDPHLKTRSLGTFTILWTLGEAQRRGLNWVYLGYWIAESQKMHYKNRFRPYEAYRDGRWQREG